MKKDTPSYDELRQDQTRHWKQIGQVRDARYQVVQEQLRRAWRCPQCGRQNAEGGVCMTCREARLIEVDS